MRALSDRPTSVRAAATATLLLALAGCASLETTDRLAAGDTAGSTLGVAVAPSRALAALPPEAGPVVSVVERRKADGEVKQTITLAGDPGTRGDDRIEVIARERGFAAVPRRIETDAIEAEMADALPGVAMTVSTRVVTTPTGPVGLATGRTADGTGCLYAWSNTVTNARPSRSASFLGLQVSTAAKTEMTVRARLCRRGWSEERLIAAAEGLRIASGDAMTALAAPIAGSVGADALASAGYGGSTAPFAAAAAPAPVVASPVAPVASASVAARPVAAVARESRPVRKVAATKPAARPAAPVAAAPAAVAPATTPPVTVAAPIPLPSGG
jgi:hypothetical protein